MSVIRLPIDLKSLYFNIKNDNRRGHTATVATPLKQGASVRAELERIRFVPENIDHYSRELLIGQILSKSRVAARITNIFIFNGISVNRVPIGCAASFCMYIREETDPKNIHYGRQKLHYPMSLIYQDLNTNINNKEVLAAVSTHLHNYAFLVEAFEYDTESTMLNFDVTLVGEQEIPYSKVFINHRGVGNKFTPHFTESSDIYDAEIISLRDKFGYDSVSPENFNSVVAANQHLAQQLAVAYLEKQGIQSVRVLKEAYPYSIFDIEYLVGRTKHYLIVKQTATKSKYFSLPLSKIKFLNDFCEEAKLMLITDIVGDPKIYTYSTGSLNGMNKSINSITFEDRS